MSDYRVLVVDDDTQSLEGMRELVRSLGLGADGAGSAEEASSLLAQKPYDLVITDLVLPGSDGLSLISRLRSGSAAPPPVVLVTGHGSMESAVAALRAGASDYFTKPIDPSALKQRLQNLLANRPQAPTGEPETLSMPMARLFETLGKLARSEGPVLLAGEPGSGREWCAGWLYERSGSKGPMVKLHAAALPAQMVADELFGTPAREGRLEQAAGGTLFIDDIELLDAPCQRELLRWLQTGTWSRRGDGRERHAQARLIVTTGTDPGSLAEPGPMIEGLWKLLEPGLARVPALRERAEDIPALARRFAADHARSLGKAEPRLPPETIERLSSHPWPGNVRELRGVIERAVANCTGGSIGTDLLPTQGPARNELRIPIGTRIKEVEREMIMRTLDANGGNKNRTAKQLGISRRSLYNKLERYRIGLGDKVPQT
jgi:DNA-binding NtrC family response regulator